ncbi:unnamed protein product [Parnassius apollo]|uniref:(apollo) hypothetical protein n=1 Tax=Parnassius apollo TaxID=110799 RepID=A0A8S3WL30_PARAO|nr:unnamed protein product [Parnassius apollo]
MSNFKSYRACFVPLCSNNNSQKYVFNVPRDPKRRSQCFQRAYRRNPTTLKYFCCEDHFDFKEDVENYFYYTLRGGRAKIKVDIVPHKFNYQPNRKR